MQGRIHQQVMAQLSNANYKMCCTAGKGSASGVLRRWRA